MDNECNIDIEVMKSKSITSLAAVIIESAKVEIDFIRIHGNEGTGTGFIPVERKELK